MKYLLPVLVAMAWTRLNLVKYQLIQFQQIPIRQGVRVTYEKSLDRPARASSSGLADATMAELFPLQQTRFNVDDGERIKQIVCFRCVCVCV